MYLFFLYFNNNYNVHLNLFCVVCITLSIDLIYQLNAYHIFFEVYKFLKVEMEKDSVF